jgi:hypothetical protein
VLARRTGCHLARSPSAAAIRDAKHCWHHKDLRATARLSRRPVLSPLAPVEPVSEHAWPLKRKRPLGLRTLSATRGKPGDRDEPRRFHECFCFHWLISGNFFSSRDQCWPIQRDRPSAGGGYTDCNTPYVARICCAISLALREQPRRFARLPVIFSGLVAAEARSGR